MAKKIRDEYERLVAESVRGMTVDGEDAAKYLLYYHPTPESLKQMTRVEKKKLAFSSMRLARFLAAVELGQLVARSYPEVLGHAYSSIELGAAMIEHFNGIENEQVAVAYTNVHNEIVALKTLFSGGRSECVLYPDQIFKQALLNSASGLVLIHNHPTGDVQPSQQDLAFSRRLERGGRILGITVLDFLIVGRQRYYSWREQQGAPEK